MTSPTRVENRQTRDGRRESSHVAIFLPSLDFGGVEKVMLTLGGGFAERGLRVDLVLGNSHGPFANQIPPNLRVFDLKCARMRSAFKPLVRYLQDEVPDVFITSKEYASLLALWARQVARVSTQIVITAHSMLSREWIGERSIKGLLILALVRRYYHRADRFIAVSKGLARDFSRTVGIPASGIDVIYNPVVVTDNGVGRAEHPWFDDGQPPVIVGAGRLVQEKGFSLLIEAFGLLRRRSRCRLMILGEGPDRARLEAISAKLGLQRDVDLVGYVHDPGAYVSRARVFALSSQWESLPTVVIEALAVGTPVVAVDCAGGIREIIKDAAYGILVPPGSPTSLADALACELARPRKAIPPDAWQPFTLKAAIDNYMRSLELRSCATP